MSTPIVMDTFTRIMAALFDEKEIIAVPTGFQAFFGRPETGAQTIISPDANAVDIDIIRGNEKTAALIPRGAISRPLGPTQRNMDAQNYTSFSRKYPLSEEEADITPTDRQYLAGFHLARVSKGLHSPLISEGARLRYAGLLHVLDHR